MVTFAGRKRALQSLYEDTCTVTEYLEVKDPVTKVTKKTEVITLESQPCRISYRTISEANGTDFPTTQSQLIKLFIDPEVTIKPGSKITIIRGGMRNPADAGSRTVNYRRTGNPAIYQDHQEVILELYEAVRNQV